MMIHSHRNMHPGEFRSFSAREYARAQGFPDWYKICGSASKYCNKKCVSTLSHSSVALDASFEPDATLLRMAGGRLCRYDNPKALVPLNKFQQIGNAVSPRLARAMGECLLMSLIYGTPSAPPHRSITSDSQVTSACFCGRARGGQVAAGPRGRSEHRP